MPSGLAYHLQMQGSDFCVRQIRKNQKPFSIAFHSYRTTVASSSMVSVAKSPFTSNKVVACLIPYF